MRWDPVGALHEDGLPVDPEVEAEAGGPGGPGDRLLDQLHPPEIHLRTRDSKPLTVTLTTNSNTNH